MKNLDRIIRSRYLLALVGGLLWAAAFPNLGVAGLAWIAPGVMVAAALGKTGGERFRLGYVAGLAHYLAMLYWLLLIPYRWHGIPLGPAAGWLALSAFLSLYPAVWVWLVAPGPSAMLRPWAQNLAPTWVGRTLWALTGAAVWVALEMGLARIFGGFPWDILGVSQYQMTPLIQFSSVTGVYGVSFLIIWLSLSLLSAALAVVQRPSARSVWIGEVFLPVLVGAVLFNLGFRQPGPEPASTRKLRLTLVQPSIPQTLIWDSSGDDARFQDLLRLTEQTLTTNHPQVVLWPESAVPKMLRYDTNTFEAITGLARRHHVWMIVGSDDAEPSRSSANPEDAEYYNSSFLVSPQGQLRERYIKRNLVIFGEYIPLAHVLPFLKWFTPIQGGFTPGRGPVQFNLADLDVRTSVLICFEDVFPQIARSDVQPDTDFLVNLTNDGWFGEGAAQWQQAATAVFRAIENRVPLVRCANNGLTCWVDAQGRMRDLFRDARGSVYGPGALTVDVPVLEPGATHPPTFYNRHGDWFGWGCVAVAGLALVNRLRPGRNKIAATLAETPVPTDHCPPTESA